MPIISENERCLLAKSRICLLGYGAQGEAEATNLQRSEIAFTLGLRSTGKSAEKARANRVSYVSFSEAIENSDTIVMNLADHSQREIYYEFPKLKLSKRLIFAHGFNTHFKMIPVEENGPRHILVAPKGAASGLKEFYGTNQALPALLAAQPSPTPEEKTFAEIFAKAIGCHPAALIWADFKDETECDLFSEQALLCGGVSSLLRTSYEVLIENGYHPDAAYFETLYELKLIVDLIWKEGISGMRNRISPTARYGDITRGDRVIGPEVKAKMVEVLEEIQSGKFAREFLEDRQSEKYLSKLEMQKNHPIEKVGQKLRDSMKLT